jgi:amidase
MMMVPGSLVEAARGIERREISPVELTHACLERIAARNDELHAFITVLADQAVADAKRAEQDIANGKYRGPLHGIPVSIKDLVDVAGVRTTYGSPLYADHVPDADALVVQRLRRAGAIVVGKTNTPELGLRPVTENERFGATRNPRNPRLSAGGSSGGSAAAVAAGMVALADGSDLGGSIRIPASCCGLVGLKPSRGRVSIGPDYGLVGLGTPADGVLTRTVLDTAVALDVIAGYEPGDHHFLPPPGSFAEAARRPPSPSRILLATTAPLGVPVDSEAREAAERAAATLAELGHDVEAKTLDWDDDAFPGHWQTFATGTIQHLVRALERLHGRPLDPDGLEPTTRAWAVDSDPVALIDFLEAGEALWSFARRLLRSWPPNSMLLTPTLTRLPAEVAMLRSSAGVTDDAVRFSALVRLWNVTGQPAISVPLHETDDGTPVGVQLVGPPARDDLVISLAAQLEQPTRKDTHPRTHRSGSSTATPTSSPLATTG